MAEHPVMRGLVAVPFTGVIGGVSHGIQHLRQTHQAVRYDTTIPGQAVDIPAGQQHRTAGDTYGALMPSHDMRL